MSGYLDLKPEVMDNSELKIRGLCDKISQIIDGAQRENVLEYVGQLKREALWLNHNYSEVMNQLDDLNSEDFNRKSDKIINGEE